MASDWYEEMEKDEQEYDAREYELAQEYSRGYEQGRADKYQEIVSEHMLLTEEQVAEIRADAIDECIKVNHIAWERYVNDYSLGQKRRGQLNAMFVGILDRLEQLKEQNNDSM